MVRMRGLAFIGVPSGSSDVEERLTHENTPGVGPEGKRKTACRRTMVSGTPSRVRKDQPAFCCSQA